MSDNITRGTRKALRAWRIAPLAILLLAGCQKQKAIEEDARQTVNQLKQATEARGAMAVDPNAGPMTRLTAIVGNMILADTNAFSAASKEAGLEQIVSFEGLTTSSPVLDHCERIDALGPRSKALAARYPVYIDAVRSEGGKLVAAGKLPQDQVDGMIKGLSAQQQAFNRQWTLGGTLAGQAGEMCRILARRHWQDAGGTVQFSDQADLAEATAVRGRMQPVMEEINTIGTNARAKSADAMHKLEGP